MDFSTLEKAWRKQRVTGGDAPAEMIAARMKREVAIAHRRIRGGIVLAALVLFTGWGVTIVSHVTSIKRVTPISLVADAVSLVLFVVFFIRAFQSEQVVRREIEMLGGTLRESVAAALRTVELQIENGRIFAYAIPLVMAISAWLFVAKYLAGDLPGFGAAVGVVSSAAIAAAIGGAIWHRVWTQLVPRRKELREMLHALDGEAE
jgi:hypothetical protein